MTKQNIQNQLEQTLCQLLQTADISQISVSQIVQVAGISRANFYNYYSDKYAIIDTCQQRVFARLEVTFQAFQTDKRTSICNIFQTLAEEDLFATLLLPHGNREIHDFLRHKFQVLVTEDLQSQAPERLQPFNQTELDYCVIYLTSAYFAICQTWIAKGKKESPLEMADFLMKMIQKQEN